MKASEFDRMFDDGEDISHFVDWKSGRRPGREAKSVSFDFPNGKLQKLDCEARRLGITREELIARWLAEKLEHVV